MIKAEYLEQEFIIDKGKVITDSDSIKQVFDAMYQDVDTDQGQPDYILCKRLLSYLGGGKVIGRIDDTDPERVY